MSSLKDHKSLGRHRHYNADSLLENALFGDPNDGHYGMRPVSNSSQRLSPSIGTASKKLTQSVGMGGLVHPRNRHGTKRMRNNVAPLDYDRRDSLNAADDYFLGKEPSNQTSARRFD